MTPDRAESQIPIPAHYNPLTTDKVRFTTKDLCSLEKGAEKVNEFLDNWGMEVCLQKQEHYEKSDVRILLKEKGEKGKIIVPTSRLMGTKKGRERFLVASYKKLLQHIWHEDWQDVTKTTIIIMTALDINPLLRGKVPGIFAARMNNARIQNSLDKLAATCVDCFAQRVRNVHISSEYAGLREMAVFVPSYYKELGNLSEIRRRSIYWSITAPNQLYGM